MPTAVPGFLCKCCDLHLGPNTMSIIPKETIPLAEGNTLRQIKTQRAEFIGYNEIRNQKQVYNHKYFH